MTYKEFIAILKENGVKIQAYMRLAGLSPNAYVRWKQSGKLPAWRAEQVLNRYKPKGY